MTSCGSGAYRFIFQNHLQFTLLLRSMWSSHFTWVGFLTLWTNVRFPDAQRLQSTTENGLIWRPSQNFTLDLSLLPARDTEFESYKDLCCTAKRRSSIAKDCFNVFHGLLQLQKATWKLHLLVQQTPYCGLHMLSPVQCVSRSQVARFPL